MLTQQQQDTLLKEVLAAFKSQKGISFDYNEFQISVGKPNDRSMCSLNITSDRRDDNFRIKLYIIDFKNFTTIGNFVFTQEENYSTGLNDEVFICDCSLDKNEYRGFYFYLLSPKFTSDVMTAVNNLGMEDSGCILLENGSKILMEG